VRLTPGTLPAGNGRPNHQSITTIKSIHESPCTFSTIASNTLHLSNLLNIVVHEVAISSSRFPKQQLRQVSTCGRRNELILGRNLQKKPSSLLAWQSYRFCPQRRRRTTLPPRSTPDCDDEAAEATSSTIPVRRSIYPSIHATMLPRVKPLASADARLVQ
jgi:hypothetical protein